MDLLSNVLDSLRPQSSVLSDLRLSAPWGLDLDPSIPAGLAQTLERRSAAPLDLDRGGVSGSPMHFVVEGVCWVKRDGGKLTELHAGDLVMFPHWNKHCLLSSPNAAAVHFLDAAQRAGVRPWIPGARAEAPVSFAIGGGGAVTRILSGAVHFEHPGGNPLLKELPKFIHLNSEQTRMAPLLRTILQYIAEETAFTQPGYATVAIRLAELLFIQIIRTHLLLNPLEATGWLRGLADPHVSAAIRTIHGSIDDRWTVKSLARVAGLSRSAFAKRFKDVTGTTPMDYLCEWRMHIAAKELIWGKAPVAAIAQQVGYRTTFSFAEAFKQRCGMSPGQYRRLHRNPPRSV